MSENFYQYSVIKTFKNIILGIIEIRGEIKSDITINNKQNCHIIISNV